MTQNIPPIPEDPSGNELTILLQALFDEVHKINERLEQTNDQVRKWDGRLWTLTLGLIGSAWTAIIAAAVVVIVRALTKQ